MNQNKKCTIVFSGMAASDTTAHGQSSHRPNDKISNVGTELAVDFFVSVLGSTREGLVRSVAAHQEHCWEVVIEERGVVADDGAFDIFVRKLKSKF